MFAHRSRAHFTNRLLIKAYSFPLSLVDTQKVTSKAENISLSATPVKAHAQVYWGEIYFLQFTLALLLQLLERIQDSVSGMGERMATISAVSNLERRPDALEGQAAENQCNLVRSSLLLASS